MATHQALNLELVVRLHLPHPERKLIVAFLEIKGKEECLQETGLSAVLAGTSTITTLVGDVFDMITANPLLCVFVAASLLGVGISVFKRIKRAAR